MRVAVDIREYSEQPAGIGYYCGHLAASLAASNPGEDLLLIGHDSFPGPEERSGFEAYPVGNRWQKGFARAWWENVHLPVILRRRKVDLYHATSHIIPPFWAGLRLVITIHDMSNFLFPEWYRPRNNRYRSMMIRKGLNRADAVIAVSRSTAHDIATFFPEAAEKTHVVYEAVTDQFSPVTDPEALSGELLEAASRPFLLFVGTSSPRKNLSALIRAFGRFSEGSEHRDYRLLLSGKRGWYDEALLRLPEELGVADKVLYLGYPSRRALCELYRRARLFCFPSLYEGFGLPVLEAMASGTPVLASDRGALPELVVDPDCLVDPTNPVAMAERIGLLVSDDALRERLIRSGLERSREFSWERAARSTWNLYQSVE